MSPTEELNVARKKLFDRLGDNTKQYYHLMKLWFSMKITKEEFDSEARKMMTREQTRLHNEFLLCLFNKCQFLGSSGKSKAKDAKKVKLSKMKRSSDKGAFQLADPAQYLPQLESPPQHLQEEPQRYCVQELFLPDQSLIMSRLLLTSWEMGMDGAEDSAAELLVIAVQFFLKNVLTAVLSLRNGYKVREKRFKFAMGSSVPNPWLRNYHSLQDDSLYGNATEIVETDEDCVLVPRAPLTPEELERREAYRIACCSSNRKPAVKTSVTTYDILQALQIHKSSIPSHSLYSINLERIISHLYHPSHEEIEASKYFQDT